MSLKDLTTYDLRALKARLAGVELVDNLIAEAQSARDRIATAASAEELAVYLESLPEAERKAEGERVTGVLDSVTLPKETVRALREVVVKPESIQEK